MDKSHINENMIEYYARRAAEYERIYQKPERQKDIRLSYRYPQEPYLKIGMCWKLPAVPVTGPNVSPGSAGFILATDFNSEVIKIARHKHYKKCKVSFRESDAYSLSNVRGDFTGGFCGFWWSHIPRARIQDFLLTFHSKLQNDALVVMVDNKYVEGSSTRLSRTDSDGNTYQMRRLQDGSLHEVLKNFPTEEEIKTSIEKHSKNFYFIDLEYYWLVKYQVDK